ncbi:MAG: restriction endonuclease subunit S [Rhodospirillaceae bacterium]
MPFTKAVVVNPPVPLKKGKVYPFVDMASVNPAARSVQESEHREFTGGGSRFVPGDTLMARITPCLENGKIARFRPTDAASAGFGSTEFIVIRGRDGLTDNDFAYYLTKWDEFRQFAVSQMAGTSGRQRVPAESLAHFTVAVPPLPVQRRIAAILGALDDKIELNRRMSRTLEEMARALFKSWFVDFEPVRAKMEGRWKKGQSLPGLPADLYDLFPDRLVDSELGEIPAGWKAGTVGDELIELVSGARPKGGAVDNGVPSIGAENVIGLGRYDYSKEKFVPSGFFERLKLKGADVRPGDVLLYKDGAQIGRKAFFDRGFPHRECVINEHVFILRCATSLMQRYLFFWLDLPWMTSEIVALNSNSAQPGINQAGVRKLPLLRPTAGIVNAFDRLVAPLTDSIFERCLESRTLAAIRDALLPKLLSGEIDVSTLEGLIDEPASVSTW